MTEIRLSVVDLTDSIEAAVGNGVQWSLSDPSQLDVNLVHLESGGSIGEHVADDVDVIIVVLAGSGILGSGDRDIQLGAHLLVHVPAGVSRAMRAEQGGLTYLTVHRRRGGIQIGHRPQRLDRPTTATYSSSDD
jgi:quercetin dioxygenase-like cupin family protein